MKIEHIAPYVNDLEAARDFFTSYLGGNTGSPCNNTNEGNNQRTREPGTVNRNSLLVLSCYDKST